ncbi:MAG: alpha/beta hydrolase [Verrucomicrobiota bacterium]|nr:alpha/beta hydrolase [Verrucomicrobiota bacterium]
MKSASIFFLATTLLAGTVHAGLERNIPYEKVGGRVLRLDANVPDGMGPFPVVLAVHGGGWCVGDKSGKGDFAPILKLLTAHRFVWFSIDYRLAPTNRWPACFDDVQAAIRWVKAHAAEYKGAPGRIALLGYSAGGHLVCLAATLATPATRVQAVVGLAPPTDLVTEMKRRGEIGRWSAMRNVLGRDALDAGTWKLLRQLSPIEHVKPGLPPFLLMQGDADKTVPPPQTRNFAARLKADGVPCELYFIKGAGHNIANWAKLDPACQQELVGWLKEALSAKGR